MSQQAFSNYMTHKYGEEGQFNKAHHYETTRVVDSAGRTVLKAGLEVPSNFTFEYFDTGTVLKKQNVASVVSNFDYEDRIQLQKRNIFLLKPRFLNIAIQNLDDLMKYRKGSTQYVSKKVVRGDNVRIYQ